MISAVGEGVSSEGGVPEAQLARQSRRFGHAGGWFLAIGLIVGVPGIVLIVLGPSWMPALGPALVAIAFVPWIVALSLLLSSAAAHWTARRRPFAQLRQGEPARLAG